MAKQKLLFQLTNMGEPNIAVVDGNYENRSELLLKHSYEGIDLRQDYMRDTLANLHAMWTRPVVIATRMGDRSVLVRFDGKDYQESPTEAGS